jgi:hypothetical protein
LILVGCVFVSTRWDWQGWKSQVTALAEIGRELRWKGKRTSQVLVAGLSNGSKANAGLFGVLRVSGAEFGDV